MDSKTRLALGSVPGGTFQARVSATGRLQLPSKVLRYFSQIGDPKGPVFVTTFDLSTARVFTEAGWEVMRDRMRNFTENREAAATVMEIATGYGQDADLDDKGRLVIHPRLRREIGMEEKELAITCDRGYATLYDQAAFEQNLENAKKRLASAVEVLTSGGLFSR